MESVLIVMLGLLVTISIFYAKDADVLSKQSLRFIKTVAIIVACGSIVLGIVYMAITVSTLFNQ